ncbi:MAG: hypothetical protein HOV94_07560, partial [Saccharothrix sp.]|nr:hypothetical protein [Saccharothrix sp.]
DGGPPAASPTFEAQLPPTVRVEQPSLVMTSSVLPGTAPGGASVTPGAPVDPSAPEASGTTTTTAAGPGAEVVVPEGFTLSTGGPPVDLPVTVRNTGSTPIAPPSVALTLFDDLKVVGPGKADGTVRCPAGKGAVTCAAVDEVPAGGSVTFVFRLQAGPKSVGGTLRGTVTTGSGQDLPVEVPVAVAPR